MESEIQLISDGDGLAVIGDPVAVEGFLAAEALDSSDLGLPQLGRAMGVGAGVAQAGSELAVNSGRWVKLTEHSARQVERFGLRQSSTTGLSTGVVKGSAGQVGGFVEFVKGPGALATSPALLAGAAGLMAQVGMQQTMSEITDYLATIDEKVGDVLRAQKDAVLADMIGVDLVIEDAMTIRREVGLVSETTWSKVQGTSLTVARTQGYALRQLDAIAEKLEQAAKIGDQAKAAKEAEPTIQEWLAVLARCFQLQDAVSVLELDRVLGASPDDLDQHRLALRATRRERVSRISRTTERLVSRMNAAANAANAQVLLHPSASGAIVRSSNRATGAIVDFHQRLGIEGGRESLRARRWVEAAAETRDRVIATGAEGVDSAKRLGSDTIDSATSMTGKLTSGFAGRARRWRPTDKKRQEER